MWQFILFLRDRIVDITNLLDRYSFSIAGMDITIFEMLLGIIAMGIVIAVFWKGART